MEKGSEWLPALGGLTIEEVLRQVKGQDYSTYPHIRAEVIVDEHMRAVGVQWSEQEEAIVAALQEWTRALATNTTPVASGGRSHRSVPAVDYAAMAAGRDQPPPARQENPAMVAHLLTGQLRVDVPAELGWIFNEQRLPYKSKGGQDGLLTVCAQLGIPLAARQRTAALLREKLYAYHAAVRDGSTQPAALAAAAEFTAARMVQKPTHSPVPADVNLSGTNMFFLLFTFVFRSNDVDALLGAVAFCVGLVLVLRSTDAGVSVAALGPRLLLQMHPKSMDTCAAFGLLQHQSLVGSGAAQLGGSVNANLVEALEGDSGLPVLNNFGDRALSAVFIFCTVNNDCKGRLRHLSSGFMLSVLRGVYYKRAVCGRTGREPAPLSAVGGSAIGGQLVGPAFSVSVRGATVLWHIACCVRPRTLKCIIAKNGDQVELMDVPYNHARGFGRMGLESPPAPVPYAWWCLLSCVTLIVRQVAAYPFDNDPRPLSASAAEEVYGTSFVMSDNNTGVKPDYSVVLAGVPATAGINTAVQSSCRAPIRRGHHGHVFRGDFPFACPRECIFAASEHNGKEPLQTVATDALLKNQQALLSIHDLQQWLSSNSWPPSQRLKAVAQATLHTTTCRVGVS